MKNKTLLVAGREYRSTVLTKAFIFSAVIFPLIVWGLAIAIPMLFKDETPQLKGLIAVIDETPGAILPDALRKQFDPVTLQKQMDQFKEYQRKAEEKKKAGGEEESAPPKSTEDIAMALGARYLDDFIKQPMPEVSIVTKTYPADATTKEQREAFLSELKSQVRNGELTALVTLTPTALQAGTRDQIVLFTPDQMHANNKDRIQIALTESVVNARLESLSLDPNLTRLNTLPPSIATRKVTETGEQASNELADMFVPFGFMILLWISTFTGGQYLLTTTIEEKSSKIIEVLLSATSPMQLMTGKILGQGAVALTMLAIYAVLAVTGLQKTGFGDLIVPSKFIIVIPYFLMAFFFVACMMASVGSAVNDMREAQSLMGPVMMVVMLPMLAWLPIVRNPNSMISTVASFIPPITPFVMALRIGGNAQIPTWQIVGTMVIGFLAVLVFLWATAKIFRIGIMMYGKPPTFGTLLRWIAKA